MRCMRCILAVLLLAPALPVAAQWELRGGFRAGLAVATNEAHRDEKQLVAGHAVGGELWIARGPFALVTSIDYVEAGEYHPGAITSLSADLDYVLRLRREHLVWMGVGRAKLRAGYNGAALADPTIWAPNAGYAWPLRNRQLYVTVRYQNGSLRETHHLVLEDVNITTLMFGIRSENALRRR